MTCTLTFFFAALFGQLDVFPSSGATFASVSLTSLALFREGFAAPVDDAAVRAMRSPLISTSPSKATFLFDVRLGASVFVPSANYFYRAEVEFIFRETLVRRRVLLDARAAAADAQQLQSEAFNLASRSDVVLSQSVTENGSLVVIASAVGAVVATLLICFALIVIWRTKKRQQKLLSDVPNIV